MVVIPPARALLFLAYRQPSDRMFLSDGYSLQYLRIARGDARAIAETDWLGFCPAYQELAAFSRCDLGHHQAEADARTYE